MSNRLHDTFSLMVQLYLSIYLLLLLKINKEWYYLVIYIYINEFHAIYQVDYYNGTHISKIVSIFAHQLQTNYMPSQDLLVIILDWFFR